jgi:hypothetical protein
LVGASRELGDGVEGRDDVVYSGESGPQWASNRVLHALAPDLVQGIVDAEVRHVEEPRERRSVVVVGRVPGEALVVLDPLDHFANFGFSGTPFCTAISTCKSSTSGKVRTLGSGWWAITQS